MSKFKELSAIDVNEHKKKKGRFNYLSWVFAVKTLLEQDPDANWEYKEPLTLPDGSMLVFCTVTAFKKPMTCQLAVTDFNNKAIKSPNCDDLSNAMMRCLVKAIALHGLGLYIYANEDLPPHDVLEHIKNIYADEGITNARNYYATLTSENDKKLCTDYMKKIISENK